QVSVMGTFNIDSSTNLAGSALNAVKINMTVVILPDVVIKVDSTTSPGDLVNNGGTGSGNPTVSPTGRFNVRFFFKNDDAKADSDSSAWTEIPLLISKDPASDSFNVYF